MKYWRKMERYICKNKKEICLRSDFQMDEGDALEIMVGKEFSHLDLDHVEKVPKGKYYKVHLHITIQPYKIKREKSFLGLKHRYKKKNENGRRP